MRPITKNLGLVTVLGGGLALVVGCASAPPGELVEARSAYNHASISPAAQLAPAQLHSAEVALAAAEKQFDIDGNSPRTRDRAYAAIRKAQLAEAQARVAMADQTAANAERQVQLTQAQLQASTTSELNKTREQLASEQQNLASERQRREEAEKRAAQASADLARIASVKQDSRGMVITLSGGVLFASGKSALLPTAQTKLNQVAEALTKSQPDSKIVVEGYTDSSGPSSLNDRLSQERAEAVRSYLVSRGIASDRLTAQGYGPAKPIAENATPEGRANNRRVEIVVQNGATP
jgi:outer membrane protein OmpA-like peptidoglycan-associated protein